MDDKLKWMETRLSSSLRPRNEDLKNMFANDENRLAFHEFINNEDVRRLFVYIRPPRQIIASLQPAHDLKTKSVFFLKNNVGVKLTKDNMDEEVMYMDCSDNALAQLDLLTREVYLPLLCADTQHATSYGLSADKLMDLLHRLMSQVETIQGHTEGEIILPLPSIEVLAEAAENASRRGAVLHVLETTVIGWIKQIKGLLRHNPILDLERQSGEFPGPLDEAQLWQTRLEKLHSINVQLDSPVAQDILRNLEEASSTYATSFQNVRKDINRAISDTEEILKFLSTMMTWFHQLHDCLDPQEMLKLFPPLIHVLLLVWQHSKYYHQIDRFHNLLRLISNEVVHRAEAMVGEDVLREPLESYSKLKEALRVCAAFRGTYLDYRDKAEEINEQNKQEHADKMHHRPQGTQLFSTKMYGPKAYKPSYGVVKKEDDEEEMNEEELTKDSPWPPRNAPAFDLLNAFMERCNDVLELVQTTRHFRLLADAAEVGGAGSASLDALVKEIHTKYAAAMDLFFSKVSNVLAIDGTQAFEKAFFTFRTIVKDLEKKISEVLRQSFAQCPTIGAQLRLLEVFEGISGRELVQIHLRDKDNQLVSSFTNELIQVRGLFQQSVRQPPMHANMPLVVSKLMWIWGLKERINGPMQKMKKVSPHSLEGDLGWQLRDAYHEAMSDLDRFENKTINEWQLHITAELTDRLKQPLLVAEDYDEDEDIRPQVVHVNLDPELLLLLREIHYLSQEPFSLKLPGPARELLRNTNSKELRVTATRLETIVSKYNTVMKSMTEYEQPLFERSLAKIDHLFEQGLHTYTWRTEESADFIETANALVCVDIHTNLDIVQTNCHEIAQITISWSDGTVDVFTARQQEKSYNIEELVETQVKLNEDFESAVVPSGNKIHVLLGSSFEAVQISEASPAWQDYLDYIDAIVLDGLKKASLVSLKAMLNQIVKSNMNEEQRDKFDVENTIPILMIRLELIENLVAFRPPLDQNTSDSSVQETVDTWLASYLARGRLVAMLGGKGSYQDYIQMDEEVQQLVEHINKLVKDNGEECKNLFELFKDYAFLWEQDVNHTFEEFLKGHVSPNPLRASAKQSDAANQRQKLLYSAGLTSRGSSAKSSVDTHHQSNNVDRTFLTPKKEGRDADSTVPTLDEFDDEIDIYRTARDEVFSLQDYQDVGWLRVDLRPIKQVLITYSSKWMWTFTKYLSDQVTNMLENLDAFLKRIEPEIESITGEERDTASFMKMMRLFNEVSAQQHEMDGKFNAMHKTVLLVKKYGQKLPQHTQALFDAAPGRWNNLKTKVSLAKQRLGPRIQEESESISKDLAKFGERVITIHSELENSEVYNRECSIADSWIIIDGFVKRLTILESEAQDLIELQELLETNVVNFELLPQCRHDLSNLKQVWETFRIIDSQQTEWRRHRWQKMNTRFLTDETNKQLETVRNLPEDVFTWDVYMGLHESITGIQDCLPMIDDLSNPAMRTRHWKQLVRVTGGAIQIDNETLKRMTLGELLSLGLQKHVDDVRAIVQRAVKDLSIEQSLKTYEEVWLSKIFELREHVRNKAIMSQQKADKEAGTTGAGDVAGIISQSVRPVNTTGRRFSNLPNCHDTQSELGSHQGSEQQTSQQGGKTRTGTRLSNHSSLSKGRRASVSSLPQSLLALGEDTGFLYLLTNTEPIFDELESHQVSLGVMQSSSAAGSFLDEVTKWQKRLQTIEGVLTTWLQVQEKWIELEEVYSSQEVRTALSHDSNKFAAVNRDFRLLMRATDKNPNVLQCCSRKHILEIMEKMNYNLEHCRKSLLLHLERRRMKFPRFYFLSMEDVLHIVCNAYDLNMVNLYINKLFSNVGQVMFEEIDDGEKSTFQIFAVQSSLGEKLPFKEPVSCDTQVEMWLNNFISATREALKFQVATATGLEKPPSRMREIHSAGARKVKIPSKSAKGRSKTPLERAPSRSTSRQQRPKDEDTEVKKAIIETQPSWTLDHVAEIVYLVTQIQLTKQTTETLRELDEGNQESLQAAIEKTEQTLKATVVMLKGLEDEKEMRARRKLEKAKSESGEGGTITERHGSERLSESQSNPAKSHKGSNWDITKQQEHSVIPEEGGEQQSVKDEDAASQVEPSTTEPIDTMNISALPITIKPPKKEEVVVENLIEEQQIDTTDLKLMLFPSQIHKISSLVALLAHQRDLLQRLQKSYEETSLEMSSSFLWKAQLQYGLDEESKNVTVTCFDNEFNYGFEYQGSSIREVITPLTERAFLSLTQAAKNFTGGLCMGPAGNGQLATVHELAKCLGKPMYSFNCTKVVDSSALLDIFKGFAMTGCWLSFNNINYIRPEVLSVFAQLFGSIMDSLKSGKQSAHINAEDVPITADGACFGVMDTAIKVSASDPEKLLMFNAAVTKLPSELLTQFRPVSLVTPDYNLMLEVLLLSQGFLNASELAKSTVLLFDMCRNLIGTNTPLTNDVSNMAYNSSDSVQGWSRQTLKFVALEAGFLLDKLMCQKVALQEDRMDEEEEEEEEDMEPKPEDRQKEEKVEKEEAPADAPTEGEGEAEEGEDEDKEGEQEKHEKEGQEKMKEKFSKMLADYAEEENIALVTALRNTFLPRLYERDANLFATLVTDLFPDVPVPLLFDGLSGPKPEMPLDSRPITREAEMGNKGGSRPHTRELAYGGTGRSATREGFTERQGTFDLGTKMYSRPQTREANWDEKERQQKTKYGYLKSDVSRPKNFRDYLVLNTPVVIPTSAMDRYSSKATLVTRINIEDIDDAIAVATGKLGLVPGVAFQARVSQLSQLNTAHRTIIVAGPAACGKSECIKTFALAEKERGKTIDVQTIFTKSVESRELLGYTHPDTREWKEGMLASLLRRFCIQPANENFEFNVKPLMKIIQLDGDLDSTQFEMMQTILHNDGSVVLANNERIVVPDTLRFVWETESLSNLSPALLANVGVLCMTKDDVGWRMMLAMWVDRRSEADRDLLRSLTEKYVETIVQYLRDCTKAPIYGKSVDGNAFKRRCWQSEENMVMTFTNLLEALINPYPDLTDVEIERYFNYAAIWAFGGTLDMENREALSLWWRQTFDSYIEYPEGGLVYDYSVCNETHEFLKWQDQVPQYSGTPHTGIPSEAFVNTVNTQQLLHLLGLLNDCGKPVMLIGENGCGKSAIVNERIRTVCSGEVAEVLSLVLQANRFTNGRLLYDRLDEKLEWKHGRTYVPKGNKKLLCFVDDINLGQVDNWHNQTAVELVRQHIDDGGFYDPEHHGWRYVKSVTYVTTVNPNTAASVPNLNTRLLRHFALFHCPYPGSSELQSVYSILLQTHFIQPEMTSVSSNVGGGAAQHLGIEDKKEKVKLQNEQREEEEAMKTLLGLIVRVTIELQDKLRYMFLPTSQRCHYIFTMKDLGVLFRNLCLSMRPGCRKEDVLLLWEHECHWVYGHRMVNEVDHDRYKQAFIRAVRKDFTNEDHISLLSKPQKPVFSSLIEQDSGLVTAGNLFENANSSTVSEDDLKTDLYKAEYDLSHVRGLLEHGVEEYNKSQPRIKLALYRSVVEQVCRLARVVASPHEVSHCILVAEGCPGRCTIMANLAAHLCGFEIFKINPSPISIAQEYKLETFKADLVTAYTRAGVKGEKILFLLEELEVVDEDFLVYLTEFIVSGTISHLFTYEEQTTIINSIRTEVTQAGLVYTREVAWNFFLKIVKKNFRICFIVSDIGSRFQRRCREYPSFVKSVNFLWFAHWSKRQLIRQAAYHIKGVKWMDRKEKENISHMLSTMHMVVRQQDGQEQTSGQFSHLTNLTYEKFVERFISLANARFLDISETHNAMQKLMGQIQVENTMATKLKRELEHEKVVLEERKAGTVRILSQIGQDTAITEQQIRIVKAQMEKIHRLKKLLPEYQVSHERAVYKTVAIVADTKKIVQNINMDSLAELRSTNKPVIDVEDLMAAIIMILKNPQADLTWQKGAKRQMANLERFIEELMTFDEHIMPEQTLVLVEPYLKKPSFDPVSLEKKTQNPACASLCKWVKGVCRYHRMMISKVKPLHNKVDQTTQAIDDAEHKMSILENKRRALEVRLADLAKGFEEATIDKNEQEQKTVQMDKLLETAARLRKVLKKERLRIQQVIDSLPHRQASISGSCAMSAAFATYLGPYHYNFRRLMLTVHWPNCLRERGVPLTIDSIDELKGRVVDWAIEGLKTASGSSELPMEEDEELDLFDDEEEDELEQPQPGDDDYEEEEEMDRKEEDVAPADNVAPEEGGEKEEGKKPEEGETKEESAGEGGEEEEGKEKGESEENEKGKLRGDLDRIPEDGEYDPAEEEEEEDDEEEEELYREGGERPHSQHESHVSVATLPVITAEQYQQYVRSLVKLMVGEKTTYEWVKRDFGQRQLENAAIIVSSWQRPPMLIDPYGEGLSYIQWLSATVSKKRPVVLDMDTRSDPNVILAIEKSIMRGKPVLLENCEEYIDSMVTPIIHHRNTALENEEHEEPRLIKHAGRKILCHPKFKLYMATTLPKPKFSPVVASTTTLVNYGSSNETLVDDLLVRAFARIRPELYKERRLALDAVLVNTVGLKQVKAYFREKLQGNLREKKVMFDEKDVDIVADVTQKSVTMTQKLKNTKDILSKLDGLKEELFPLARRATMLYALLQSMACVQREYHFTLPHFFKMFDEAIGGEFPAEYYEDEEGRHLDDEDSSTEMTEKKMPQNPSGQTSGQTTGQTAGQTAGTENPNTIKEEDEYKEDFENESNKPESTRESQGGETTTEVKTEEDKVPVFEVPEGPELPSEGVEYNGLPDNQVKQMMDKLTALVFQRCQGSLYEEHRLLFATLLCLNMQEEGQHFTEEELSLLLQGKKNIKKVVKMKKPRSRNGNPGLGMQLSLTDFDCDEDPPQWLAQEKWEDIMAVSVLPGPLDSLCVHIATHSDDWKDWYKSESPETEPIPIKDESKAEEKEHDDQEREGNSRTPDLGPLSDFHQLLLLRLLRHDRFPIAMARYVSKHLSLNLEGDVNITMEQLMDTLNYGMAGVMLMTPPGVHGSRDSHHVSSLKMTGSPTDNIRKLAETQGVQIEVVTVGEGNDMEILGALEHAEREDNWVVVQNVNLMSDKFLKELKYYLQRIAKHRNPEKSEKFCIWLTSEPCGRFPVEMLQYLFKLAWDKLEGLIQGPAPAQEGEGASPLEFTCGTLQDALFQSCISTFKSVPTTFWDTCVTAGINKTHIYAFGVIHSILHARQMFGARGLSQFYPLDVCVFVKALEVLMVVMEKYKGEPSVEMISHMLSQAIYGNIMCNVWDLSYTETIIKHILTEVISNTGETIPLGNTTFPVPPANVEVQEFGNWLTEQKSSINTMEALSLMGNVDREANDAMALEFMHLLDKLYEAQNMDLGDICVVKEKQVDVLKLRAILDNLMEQMPPMLEIGNVPRELMATSEFDFQYHRPSVLSLVTVESVMMPESIGFVLLQECLWLNCLLCHVRQNLHDLHTSLVGGPGGLPWELQEIVDSLADEQVPAAWVHPNCQPSTHSLASWLVDLKKRHQQMKLWVKQRMVPVFDGGKDDPESHGTLGSVWLGGLVNPQALFTALKHERAVLAKCHYDEVTLVSDVSKTHDEDSYDMDEEGGIYLRELYIQGADWDIDNNCLQETTHDCNMMPSVYVRPVLKSDVSEDEVKKFECPVFINRARQVCPLHLALNSNQAKEKWIMAGTAIILDPGLPEDASKKSRAFSVVKPAPSTYRSIDEQSTRQELTATESQNRVKSATDRNGDSPYSQVTYKSQQSYKPMSPQADPLPPDLQIKRENPMVREGDNESKPSSRNSHRTADTHKTAETQRTADTRKTGATQKSEQTAKTTGEQSAVTGENEDARTQQSEGRTSRKSEARSRDIAEEDEEEDNVSDTHRSQARSEKSQPKSERSQARTERSQAKSENQSQRDSGRDTQNTGTLKGSEATASKTSVNKSLKSQDDNVSVHSQAQSQRSRKSQAPSEKSRQSVPASEKSAKQSTDAK